MGHDTTSVGTADTAAGLPEVIRRVEGSSRLGLPFTDLKVPIDQCRVALLSGAGIYPSETIPFRDAPSEAWLREIARDRSAESLALDPHEFSAAEAPYDLNSLFPIERLVELENEGCIGAAAKRHFSLSPWSNPVSQVFESTLRGLTESCISDDTQLVIGIAPGADGALPVILALRTLEAAGVSTALVSVAPREALSVSVTRGYYLDFPATCPFGAPTDRMLQRNILLDCFHLLPRLRAGDWVELPYHWPKPF
ncbi:MAG: hypothetical protein RL885_08825 [Planctomycetota bacterium]